MVDVVLPAYCPDVVHREPGDRGDQPAQTARACREWRPSRCRGLYTGGYLNVPFACARSSRWSSVVAGGPRRPGSDLLSVRPNSLSRCVSTFSGADIAEVLESLSEDRPATSGKRSVGTLIGRSGARNSTGPPNRSDCAAAGRTATLRTSQQVMPHCTVDCMLNDRSFCAIEALVLSLDLLRGFPDPRLRTEVYPSTLTRVGRISRLKPGRRIAYGILVAAVAVVSRYG